MQRLKAFTLIELMVAILIVGILASVSSTIMRGRISAARWSEGKTIMGTISTALRTHVAEKGNSFTPTPTLAQLGFATSDLSGTYFTGGESGVGDFAWVINAQDPIDFLITATAPEGIESPSQITLDQNGIFTEIESN